MWLLFGLGALFGALILTAVLLAAAWWRT